MFKTIAEWAGKLPKDMRGLVDISSQRAALKPLAPSGSFPAVAMIVKATVLRSSVLVLNRVYLPVHVTSVRRAFSLIYQGTAKAVDASYQTFDFEGWSGRSVVPGGDSIGTVPGYVEVPRVIVLAHFDRVPRRHVRFSRANIFSRDRYTCQYCGDSPGRSQLNLDHVIPRSRGGKTRTFISGSRSGPPNSSTSFWGAPSTPTR